MDNRGVYEVDGAMRNCDHEFGRRRDKLGATAPRNCLLCGAVEGAPEPPPPAKAPRGPPALLPLLEIHRVAEEGSLGPCMRALTERQQRFVVAMMEIPRCEYSTAAREAGYTDGPGLCVTAHRLAHDSKVQAGMHEEAQRRFHALALVAQQKLELRLLDDNMPKLQLQAIEMVLNRGGLHARTEHKTVVEHKTTPEVLQRIKLLAERNGLDPVKLLGQAGVEIEGEFEEVPA